MGKTSEEGKISPLRSLVKAFKFYFGENFPAALLGKQRHRSSNMQGCTSHQQAEEKRCWEAPF